MGDIVGSPFFFGGLDFHREGTTYLTATASNVDGVAQSCPLEMLP
jgi:hypothetical protein